MLTSKENLPVVIKNNEGQRTVSARELYMFLSIDDNKHFNRWFKRNIEPVFEKGFDYQTYRPNVPEFNRPAIDYLLTIDTAKEIAMMSRCENGRIARRYFIEVEKKFRQLEWEGVPTLVLDGQVYVNYKSALRILGYSTGSGLVAKRKRTYPAMFAKIFNQNFITVDYAELLKSNKQLMARQLELQFENTRAKAIDSSFKKLRYEMEDKATKS